MIQVYVWLYSIRRASWEKVILLNSNSQSFTICKSPVTGGRYENRFIQQNRICEVSKSPPGPGGHDTDRCFSSAPTEFAQIASNWSHQMIISSKNENLAEKKSRPCALTGYDAVPVSAKVKGGCLQTFEICCIAPTTCSCSLLLDVLPALPTLHLNIALSSHFSLFITL